MLRADPQLQAHFDELAANANDGTLTGVERQDYEKLRAVFHVVTVLQSRARRILRDPTEQARRGPYLK